MPRVRIFFTVILMETEQTKHTYAYCCNRCNTSHEFGEECPNEYEAEKLISIEIHGDVHS